jgi:aspartyl-tRNA(Asn)/glutamyl-tRNA(Gln) amidotransferase subunit A
MPSEVSSNLGRYDGVRYGYRDADAQDLHDMYYNSRSQGLGDEAKRRIMMGTYVLSAGYYDAYYKKAMKVRTLIKQEFEDFFQKYDVIATPTTLGPAFKLGEKINDPLSMYLEDLFTVTANIAGIPGISVPSGLQNGLPVGLQLLGKQFSEQRLLQIAHHFEKKVGFKKNIAV